MTSSFLRYRFEDFEVWRIGMRVTKASYALARKFPKSEMFALTDQIKRASTSIVLNIAEGSGQPTKKGFSVYIHHAKSSALECVACIKVALQEDFITQSVSRELEDLLKEVYFKLIALQKSLRV